MFSKILTPNPALAPYVKCYLAVKVDEKDIIRCPVSCKVLPMLVFSYRSTANIAFCFAGMPTSDAITLNDKPILIGPSNQVCYVSSKGEMHLLVVILRTTGAYLFSKKPASALTNKVIKIELIEKIFNEAQEKLWVTQNANDAVQLLESYLFQHFETGSPAFYHHDLTEATDYINEVCGMVKVKALKTKIHICSRWMQKKFKEQIGMSPKAYASATRFRSLISELNNNPNLSWMDVVARYDYTDQSHLIKDFHRYTGSSPKEYFTYSLQLDQMMQEVL